MGYLTLTRKEGESIRLTVDPGVDVEKLIRQLLRDGITVHVGAVKPQGQVRISIDAPQQVCILREELLHPTS